jgi:hypothetical protein
VAGMVALATGGGNYYYEMQSHTSLRAFKLRCLLLSCGLLTRVFVAQARQCRVLANPCRFVCAVESAAATLAPRKIAQIPRANAFHSPRAQSGDASQKSRAGGWCVSDIIEAAREAVNHVRAHP